MPLVNLAAPGYNQIANFYLSKKKFVQHSETQTYQTLLANNVAINRFQKHARINDLIQLDGE